MNCYFSGRLTLTGWTIACLLGCCLADPAWANQSSAAVDGVGIPVSGSSPSPVANALLGHWVNEDGAHYYVGQQQIIVLYPGQSPNVRKQKLSYSISSVNEVTNIIEIEVETPLGWAQERQLHLATDIQSGFVRRSLTETMNITGHFFSSTWTYVDSQQQPLNFFPAQVGASIPETRVTGAGAGATR